MTPPEYSVVVPVPPLATVRVPVISASVEEAIHVGLPFWSASTNPLVEDATAASVEAEFAYKMSPAVNDPSPVPPLATGNVPVKVMLPRALSAILPLADTANVPLASGKVN